MAYSWQQHQSQEHSMQQLCDSKKKKATKQIENTEILKDTHTTLR